MSEPNTRGAEWGQYLATLEERERDAAVQAARTALLVNLPQEQVGRPPVRSLGEYLDDKIETPPMLVEPGIVARGGLTVTFARGGKGKTAVSLNRLLRWGAGLSMFPERPELMQPDHPLRALIIENEGAPGHFQNILRDMLYAEGVFEPDEIERVRENVHVWGDGGWSKMKLDDPENLALVRRAVEITEAEIVFLEPFRGLWRGDEQSSTEMANVLDALSELANDFKCGVMVTHHERKSGIDTDDMDAARGSTAFEAHAGVMERWKPVKGGKQRELSWPKNRYVHHVPSVRMEWVPERWGYRYVDDGEQVRAVAGVLERYPDQWLTVAMVSEEIGETHDTSRTWLNKAVDEHRAKKRKAEGRFEYRSARRGEPDDDQPLGI
jgi:hypothetical protein